jgi:predicted SprT family Zn-dependent metalloprotease
MSYVKKQLRDIRECNYDLFEPANIFPELQVSPVSATPGLSVPNVQEPGLIDDAIAVDTETKNRQNKELPSVEQLYEIFDRLNIKYFKNQIPRLHIKYSKRMYIAGSFSPLKNEIKMGWKYHSIFRDDIEDTMAHEMIHYFYPNHGRRFKDKAKELGASLKAKEHPDLRLACRYLYYCPNCDREYPRRKRLRMASCGKCSTGRHFDARFKLKLKKM